MRKIRTTSRDYWTIGVMCLIINRLVVWDIVGPFFSIVTVVAMFYAMILTRHWFYLVFRKGSVEKATHGHPDQIDS